MRAGFQRFLGALALLCVVSTAARGDMTVTTQSLRLTFDDRGNLTSAIACFPACSGEAVRLQQYAGDGVIAVAARPGGSWQQYRQRSDGLQELTFEQAGGARLIWRIPQAGYRLELELHDVDGLTIRSGSTFRPREAAGFGNWLEQSRYAVMHRDGVRQIGLDEDEAVETVADRSQ